MRRCERTDELQALEARYDESIKIIEDRGVNSVLEIFKTLLHSSKAVINVDLRFIEHIMQRNNILYNNYELQVRSQSRLSAVEENDQERMAIGGRLFGRMAENIRYAVLSLDGRGLTSYGDFSLVLSEVSVERRASLLEENSFCFIDRKNIGFRGKLPSGYCASWRHRDRLAIAKLGNYLQEGMSSNELEALTLSNGTDRSSDEFIEVHIYGMISIASIKSILVRKERCIKNSSIMSVRNWSEKRGISWIEY